MSALNMWIIYQKPRDATGVPFTVRRWEVRPGELMATKDAWAAESLAAARTLVPQGLFNLGRYPDDDPTIVEVWT